jgi:hypothetical protein
MGDMGDIFNDMKDMQKTQRAARAATNGAKINDVRQRVDHLSIDASGTWNITKGTTKVQFYPTKGTWQVGGKMRRGGVEKFITWLDTLA